ncbi:hypothetical protein ACJX0J_032198, partial [Zea mays]
SYYTKLLLHFSRTIDHTQEVQIKRSKDVVKFKPSDGQPTPSNVSNKNMKHGGEVLFLDGVEEVAVTITRNSQQPLSTAPPPVQMVLRRIPLSKGKENLKIFQPVDHTELGSRSQCPLPRHDDYHEYFKRSFEEDIAAQVPQGFFLSAIPLDCGENGAVSVWGTGLSGGAPDCPVVHRTVSGAPGCLGRRGRSREIADGVRLKFTGLSGVHRT